MKILVCVKRVAVLGDDVEFTEGERDVDPDYLDFAPNEWDAFAVEEALRIRETNGGEVVVATVGDEESERELRRYLAMGADRAVRVRSEALGQVDPIMVARALAEVAEAEQPDLIFCGVQSSDSVQGATGAALAGALDLPVVAVVTKLEYDGAAQMAVVHRELEGGLIAVTETETPAILTIQTGINEPRYVTLRAIQEAGEKEIEVRTPEVSSEVAYRVRRMFAPAKERAQMIAGNPSQIVKKILEIAHEAGVR